MGHLHPSQGARSRHLRRRPLLAFLFTIALGFFSTPEGLAVELRPGDIVFNEPTIFGEILRLDPAKGEIAHISAGGNLPYYQNDLLLDHDGTLLVLTERKLVRVRPDTGIQEVVSSGEHLITPRGMAMDTGGDLIVTLFGDKTNPPAVLRVNPETGAQSFISSGGILVRPSGIAIDRDGAFVIADEIATGEGALLRVDPDTGGQSVLSTGGFLGFPLDVIVDLDGSFLVTVLRGLPGSCLSGSCGGIIRIDPSTGVQTIVSSGGLFTSPHRMAFRADGSLVVADYSAFSGVGPRLLGVDPQTGAQSVLSNQLASVSDVLVVPGVPEPRAPACGDGAVNRPEESCDWPDPGACAGPCRSDCSCFEGPAPGDLLVLDLGLRGVVHIDPRTGDRAVISAANVGTGLPFRSPQGLGLAMNGDLFIGDYETMPMLPFPRSFGKVFRVDMTTGERTLLAARGVGEGSDFDPPVEIDVDASGDVLVATSSPYTGLVRVDPASGDRSTVSSASVGMGPLFYYPDGMEIESDGHVLLTQKHARAILRIDPSSGERTVATGGIPPNAGSGTSLLFPTALGLDEDGSILVGDAGNLLGEVTALLRVDPPSGARTAISGCVNTSYPYCQEILGSGAPFVYPHAIAVEKNGEILVADAYRDVIFRVDPRTGDRVEMSSPRVGRGPELLGPWNIEIVPADLDTDGDGILDDGDESGTVGDHPCGAGYTAGCDDNCRRLANPDQLDRNRDGRGDACDECASVPSPGMSHAAASAKARPADRALEARGGPVPLKPSHGCSQDPHVVP